MGGVTPGVRERFPRARVPPGTIYLERVLLATTF
jgi:hypothetical protein